MPCPGPFYPRERPDTHYIGGLVSLRAGLDCCGKPRPTTGIRSPDRPALSQLLFQIRYPGTLFRPIPSNNSIILEMEAECSSEISILPFMTSKCLMHMNKPSSSLRYTFFSSYLVPFVWPESTALVLLLEMLLRAQDNDRVAVGCTRSVVWAGHAQCVCNTSHARHMHPNMCHRTRNKSEGYVTSMNTVIACP